MMPSTRWVPARPMLVLPSCTCLPDPPPGLQREGGAGEGPGRPQWTGELLLPCPHSLAQEPQSQRVLLWRVDIVSEDGALLSGYQPRRNAGTISLSQAAPPSARIPTPTALCSSQASFLPPPCLPIPCFSLHGRGQPSLRTTHQNPPTNPNCPTGGWKGAGGHDPPYQVQAIPLPGGPPRPATFSSLWV